MSNPRILRHIPTSQEVYNKEFVEKRLGDEVIPEPPVAGVPMARVADPIEGGRWEEIISGELVRDDHWFDTPQDRDDFFVANPVQLEDGLRVGIQMDPPTNPVTYYISRYNETNNTWVDQLALGRGPKGEDGINGIDGIPQEPEDDGEIYGRARTPSLTTGNWKKIPEYVHFSNGKLSFPTPGDVYTLYVDIAEENIYRWDEQEEEYVMVSAESEPELHFVDDVTTEPFPVEGRDNRLYIDRATNVAFRFDNDSQEYVAIEASVDVNDLVSKDAKQIISIDSSDKMLVTAESLISANANNSIVVGTDDKLLVPNTAELKFKDENLPFPGIGDENVFYIDRTTDKAYRWDDELDSYVEISNAVVIPHDEFPQEGLEGKIYVDTTNGLSYYWDAEDEEFKRIGSRIDETDEDNILVINNGIYHVHPSDAVLDDTNNMIEIREGKLFVPEGNINVENIVDADTPDNAIQINNNTLYVEDPSNLILYNPDDPDAPTAGGNIVLTNVGQTTWNSVKLEERIQPIEGDVDGLDTRLTTAESTLSNVQSNQSTLQGTVTTQGADIAALKTQVPELEEVPFDPYDLHSDTNPTPTIQEMGFWDAPFFAELDANTNPDVWVRYWETQHTNIRGWYWWRNDGSGTQGWNFLAIEDSETGRIRSKNLNLEIPTTTAVDDKISFGINAHNTSTSPTIHPEIRSMVNSASLLPTLNGSLLNFSTPAGGTLQVDLAANSAFKSVTYDEPTQELVFVMSDDSIVRVPMGSLIPIFNGSTGDNIQITVDNQTNEIGAVILDGTIVKSQLHPELQEALESVPSTANFVTINSEQTVRASKTFQPTNPATPGVRAAFIAPTTDAGAIQLGAPAASNVNIEGLNTHINVPSGTVQVDAWRIKIKQTDDLEPLQIGDNNTPEILIQAQKDSNSKITIDAPEIDFGGGRITNIAAPVDLQDVPTVGYVEANFIPRGQTYPLVLEAADAVTARSLSALNPANIYFVR